MNDAKLKPVLDDLDPEEAARLREVWDLLGDEEPGSFPSAEATARVRSRVSGDARTDRAPRRSMSRRLIGVAAAVFAAAAALTWWFTPVVEKAPLGERLAVHLPDGSRVDLNSGSSIEYRRFFRGGHTVDLEGEGFFDVMQSETPFTVRTFDASVRVIGTRFNVRAWPMESGTTVALEEGEVALTFGEKVVRMKPGEIRQADEDSLALSVSDATAWLRGDLIFKDQEVGVILDEVRRRYAVHLILQSDSLRTTRLHLALRNHPDAEAVVRDLAGALGLNYRRRSNGFELYD